MLFQAQVGQTSLLFLIIFRPQNHVKMAPENGQQMSAASNRLRNGFRSDFWPHLGSIWPPVGLQWGSLGRRSAPPGTSWAPLGLTWAHLVPSGTACGPHCAQLGAILCLTGPHLPPTGLSLRSIWAPFETHFGPTESNPFNTICVLSDIL